jgi:hypothetical protein
MVAAIAAAIAASVSVVGVSSGGRAAASSNLLDSSSSGKILKNYFCKRCTLIITLHMAFTTISLNFMHEINFSRFLPFDSTFNNVQQK